MGSLLNSQPKLLHISVPFIRGADIIAKTKVDITPGEPFTYRWERHGFEVHIPAGAISADYRTVTLSIQASLTGQYEFPDGQTPVSAVFWLALNPPVKIFAEKVTIAIPHCVHNGEDAGLSFVTAKCTQKALPYKFQPLEGGSFQRIPSYGTIQVEHFSSYSAVGPPTFNFMYSIYPYYIYMGPKWWEVHITVTRNIFSLIEVIYYSHFIYLN